MKLYLDALSKIWKDLLFKIAGSLFPFYIGAFILFFLKRDAVTKVFDSQSFILYGSSFLFTTLYLWYKALDNKKNEIISLLFFLLMLILIALLYSFSLVNNEQIVYTHHFSKCPFITSFNKDKASNIDINLWAYLIFFTTLILYVYYECKIFIKNENIKSYKESNQQFVSLKDAFKNFKDDE